MENALLERLLQSVGWWLILKFDRGYGDLESQWERKAVGMEMIIKIV